MLVTRFPKPPRPGSAAARELSGLRLAAARLTHRHGAGLPGDSERYFDQVAAAELGAADLVTYQALARDLMWRYLPPARLGMDDANVSAIAIDGDDLWVGGWLGGLVRYAQSTGELQVFRKPPRSLTAHSVRDVVRIGGHVWVATNQGLSVFARASGRWHDEPPFEDAPEANRVAVVAAAGRAVYVGTLGQGLWRRDAGGWNRIGDHRLPGPFISALLVTQKNLWIGTLDLGLIRLDLDTGTLHSFDEINPDLGPRNVTAIVAGADAALWVATFGSGLFRCSRRATASPTTRWRAVRCRTTGCWRAPPARPAFTSAPSAAGGTLHLGPGRNRGMGDHRPGAGDAVARRGGGSGGARPGVLRHAGRRGSDTVGSTQPLRPGAVGAV